MLTLIIQVLCFIKVPYPFFLHCDILNSLDYIEIISLLKFPDISVLNSSNIESMIFIFNHSEQLNLIGVISK